MARAAPRICSTPRCGGLTTGRSSYCPACRKARYRMIDARRVNPDSRRYYNTKDWQQKRARILARDYWCTTFGCPRRSTEVHHKRDREAGGTDDDDNLEGKCKPCHSRITARDRAFGRGRGHAIADTPPEKTGAGNHARGAGGSK